MTYFTIDELKIASPCSVSWSSMKGNDFVRNCEDCRKNVYNLSLLTRNEANELIREKEGNLCVQLYKRFDGTLLTADCPVGLRAIRRQYIKTRAKVLASAFAIWAFITGSSSCSSVTTAGIPAPLHRSDSTQVKDTVTHP
jgi:hypothetical protein